MATHDLKTDPGVFADVLSGAKTFEIRFNDRDFQVGDTLRLLETQHDGADMKSGAPLVFTGREITKTVSHILTGYGLSDGWCCLSLAPESQASGGKQDPAPAPMTPASWRDAMRDALSVCDSVSMSRDRRIVRDGCVLYLQTEEWCKWAEQEVAPKLRQALDASPTQAPAGWVIRDRSDMEPNAIDIEGPGFPRMNLSKDHGNPAWRTLHALASALLVVSHLSAQPSGAKEQP